MNKKIEECTIEGCDALVRSRGLCVGHYNRDRNGKDMTTPIRRGYRRPEFCTVESCDRKCIAKEMCDLHYRRTRKEFGGDFFSLARAMYNESCTFDGCEDAYVAQGFCKKHYHILIRKNLDKDKELQNKYGITLIDFQKMKLDQNEVCAVCNNPETTRSSNGELRELSVHHNHTTGAVIALCCHSCNAGMGLLKDSSDLLYRAALLQEKAGL